MTVSSLPPFSSLLKSREVEDPVNVYVERPLAYAFVWAVHRTPITPNGVTLLALLFGVSAGVLWIYGAPWAMALGAALLWTSSILDGADGFLARAKNMHSQFGRALDGAADAIVAVCTVFPAFAHMYFKDGNVIALVLMVPTIVLTTIHLELYDHHKEYFLRMTRLTGKGGEAEDLETVNKLLKYAKDERWYLRAAVNYALIPFLLRQATWVRVFTPGLRDLKISHTSEELAAIYRKHNLWPMRLWTLLSLAPHTYMIALLAAWDRIDIYFWIRLIPMNILFFIVVLWQRRATEATLREVESLQNGG